MNSNTIPLPPLPLLDGCLVFDNSWLEKFQSCPFEAQLVGINKRVSASNRAGLNFGQACHTGMSMRYNTYGSEKCASTNDILAAFDKHFLDNPEPVGDHRNLNMATEFMRAYNEMYGKEPFDILKLKSGKLFVEKSFMSPFAWINPKGCLINIHEGETETNAEWVKRIKSFDGTPVFFSGRIDLGIFDSQGEWLVDHKSGFQFGKAFHAEMTSSPQFRGYAWEFKNYYGHLPKGYIINAFRIRPPVKGAEFDPSLLFRTSGKDPDFQRIVQHLEQKDIDEWEVNTFGLIEEFLWHYGRGYFGKHKKSCVGKYGPCQFFDLCNAVAPEYQKSYLEGNTFMDNTWSALNTPSV